MRELQFLMHSAGTAKRWRREGVRWILFFQATLRCTSAILELTSAADAISLILVQETSLKRPLAGSASVMLLGPWPRRGGDTPANARRRVAFGGS